MATYNELITRAGTIKNEVANKANTAIRVGSWMIDLLMWIQDTFAFKTDVILKKQEISVQFTGQNEFAFTENVSETDTIYIISQNWRGEYGVDKDFHIEYLGLPTGIIKFHSYFTLEQGESITIFYK